MTATGKTLAAAEDGRRRRWAPGTLTGDEVGWRRARRALAETEERHGRHIVRAERRLLAATRGLGYRKWSRAINRKRVNTTAEALMRARAIWDRPAVEAAHAALEQARADGDAATRAARLELADASKALLRHGPAGVQAAGMEEAELRRLARRPRQGSGAAAGKREQASYPDGRMLA